MGKILKKRQSCQYYFNTISAGPNYKLYSCSNTNDKAWKTSTIVNWMSVGIDMLSSTRNIPSFLLLGLTSSFCICSSRLASSLWLIIWTLDCSNPVHTGKRTVSPAPQVSWQYRGNVIALHWCLSCQQIVSRG